MKNSFCHIKRIAVLTSALFLLTACGAGERLARVGQPPEMTKIENPQLKEDYVPISMPMPRPTLSKKQPNSLWGSDRQAFFKDQRASNVGDILTVLVNIDDQADIENETERSRDAREDADLPGFLGYEQALDRVLPEAVSPSGLVDFGNQSNHSGRGTIEREEEIELKLAALITQVLPNGNFAIHGRQEVLVNFEKRIIQIDGVIRPEDISTQNTINSDQIAEARVVYGGEGQITDVQQPRYGQQVYDILFPF